MSTTSSKSKYGIPSRLPDGRKNPEYAKLQRNEESAKINRAKYFASEKGKAALARQRANEKQRGRKKRSESSDAFVKRILKDLAAVDCTDY